MSARMERGDMSKSCAMAERIILGIHKATAEYTEAERLHVWELIMREYRQEFSRQQFMQPLADRIPLKK